MSKKCHGWDAFDDWPDDLGNTSAYFVMSVIPTMLLMSGSATYGHDGAAVELPSWTAYDATFGQFDGLASK